MKRTVLVIAASLAIVVLAGVLEYRTFAHPGA